MNRPLVLGDADLPCLPEAFDRWADVLTWRGRYIDPDSLERADILITRATVQVNEALLRQAPRLRLAASCTAGFDHFDASSLAAHGVHWTSAPGCNARAVAEHVMASLIVLHTRGRLRRPDPRLGIVGLGHVGSRLASLARAIGWDVAWCDPPRSVSGLYGGCALSDLAVKSDVFCLHVPLSRSGPCPTAGLASAALLKHLPQGAVVVQACRGEVLTDETFRELHASRPDLVWVLDVFESEPNPAPDLVDAADLVSPHVMGHTLEAKVRGLAMVRAWIGSKMGWPQWQPTLPPPEPSGNGLPVTDNPVWDVLLDWFDPQGDDTRLRLVVEQGEPGGFDRIRRERPVRREWSSWMRHCPPELDSQDLDRLLRICRS